MLEHGDDCRLFVGPKVELDKPSVLDKLGQALNYEVVNTFSRHDGAEVDLVMEKPDDENRDKSIVATVSDEGVVQSKGGMVRPSVTWSR